MTSRFERQPLPQAVDRAVPAITKLVDFIIRRYATPLEVVGQRNLDRALEMGELLIEPNHTSNADGPTLDLALRRLGVEDAVYIMGIRLEKHLVTNLLVNAASTIRIWPNSEEPKDEFEREEKVRRNVRAIRAANEVLKQGHPVVVFPEGSRSCREDGLTDPVEDVGVFLRKNRVILPVGIVGTRNVLPVGKIMPVKAPVEIRFGKPMSVDELMERHDNLERKFQRVAVVEDVMKEIARELPEDLRGIYRKKI